VNYCRREEKRWGEEKERRDGEKRNTSHKSFNYSRDNIPKIDFVLRHHKWGANLQKSTSITWA
jgi:hypothetical protein